MHFSRYWRCLAYNAWKSFDYWLDAQHLLVTLSWNGAAAVPLSLVISMVYFPESPLSDSSRKKIKKNWKVAKIYVIGKTVYAVHIDRILFLSFLSSFYCHFFPSFLCHFLPGALFSADIKDQYSTMLSIIRYFQETGNAYIIVCCPAVSRVHAHHLLHSSCSPT